MRLLDNDDVVAVSNEEDEESTSGEGSAGESSEGEESANEGEDSSEGEQRGPNIHPRGKKKGGTIHT